METSLFDRRARKVLVTKKGEDTSGSIAELKINGCFLRVR
jgi:hypothetical protein